MNTFQVLSAHSTLIHFAVVVRELLVCGEYEEHTSRGRKNPSCVGAFVRRVKERHGFSSREPHPGRTEERKETAQKMGTLGKLAPLTQRGTAYVVSYSQGDTGSRRIYGHWCSHCSVDFCGSRRPGIQSELRTCLTGLGGSSRLN